MHIHHAAGICLTPLRNITLMLLAFRINLVVCLRKCTKQMTMYEYLFLQRKIPVWDSYCSLRFDLCKASSSSSSSASTRRNVLNVPSKVILKKKPEQEEHCICVSPSVWTGQFEAMSTQLHMVTVVPSSLLAPLSTQICISIIVVWRIYQRAGEESLIVWQTTTTATNSRCCKDGERESYRRRSLNWKRQFEWQREGGRKPRPTMMRS